MDMLFDPYSDGPFKAAPATAARTKSPAEGAVAVPGGGGGVRAGRPPEGHSRGHRPDAAALLEGLNPQQEEAVKHSGPALLIVAGAGSGKTRVLSNRIAYLIATGRAHHGEILA